MQVSEPGSQALAVWRQLEKIIERESHPRLSRDTFILNKDAYTRLTDEDIASDAPFMSYEYGAITGDESLDFSLHLFRDYFLLVIGPLELGIAYGVFGYDSTTVLTGDDDLMAAAKPAVIARNLITTLKLLLNGQISLGCNLHNGQCVALELFLTGFQAQPLGINFGYKFPLFVTQADTYVVKQNRLLADHVAVKEGFPLLPPIVDGRRVNRGRAVTSVAGLEPLSKKDAEHIDQQVTLHELAGRDVSDGTWTSLYTTVDFWLMTALYGGLIWALQQWTPARVFFAWEYSHLVVIAGGWWVIATLTGFSLARRQDKINRGMHPLRYRIEEYLKATDGWRVLMAVCSVATSLALTTLPLWTLRGDWSGIYPLYDVIAAVPLVALLPVLALLIGVVLAGRSRPPVAFAWVAIALIAGLYAAFFTINSVYMNIADNAPALPDVSAAAFFAPLTLLSGAIFYIVRHYRERKHAMGQAGVSANELI